MAETDTKDRNLLGQEVTYRRNDVGHRRGIARAVGEKNSIRVNC